MSSQIENNYILITGATSDIGRSIAEVLSPSYNLLLHGRDNEKLVSLAKGLRSNNLVQTWCYDLKSVDGISQSLNTVVASDQFQISGFIHCAATLKVLPLKNFRPDYYREIFDVNIFSAVEIIKNLVKKGNIESLSNIIMISAYFSRFGDKGNSMYAASKGAIDSLVKSLAVEFAPRIRVNSILPGAIRTKMTSHLFSDEEYMARFDRKYLLGEGRAADIANMVLFLLSSSASWITGQNFPVDGGASSH